MILYYQTGMGKLKILQFSLSFFFFFAKMCLLLNSKLFMLNTFAYSLQNSYEN